MSAVAHINLFLETLPRAHRPWFCLYSSAIPEFERASLLRWTAFVSAMVRVCLKDKEKAPGFTALSVYMRGCLCDSVLARIHACSAQRELLLISIMQANAWPLPLHPPPFPAQEFCWTIAISKGLASQGTCNKWPTCRLSPAVPCIQRRMPNLLSHNNALVLLQPRL